MVNFHGFLHNDINCYKFFSKVLTDNDIVNSFSIESNDSNFFLLLSAPIAFDIFIIVLTFRTPDLIYQRYIL